MALCLLVCVMLCLVVGPGVVSPVLLPHQQQPLTASLVARMREAQHESVAAPPSYSNDWAVQVQGGLQAAQKLATAAGFINMGQV